MASYKTMELRAYVKYYNWCCVQYSPFQLFISCFVKLSGSHLEVHDGTLTDAV